MKIEKTVKELIDQIHAELEKKFEKKLAKIILFGSYARGDYDQESDLDILEVNLTIKFGILPSIVLRNSGYFYENREIIPFFKAVANEGVEIYAA